MGSSNLTLEPAGRIPAADVDLGIGPDSPIEIENSCSVILEWKCGDPYQYLVPKPNGDPWQVLLDYVLKEDTQRCQQLQDQVQLALVVAALFSAVVVSLLIQKAPILNADPNDEIIDLLTRLVTITENPKNTTFSSIPLQSWQQIQDGYEATLISYGAIFCYYISVWFSMGTVVLGISALQWLQAHQLYPPSTPKQQFAIFHMRRQAFTKWGVALVIRLLPVLLLASLYAFLMGFSDLFIVVLVLDAVQFLSGFLLTFSIFFLTVLPTLQEYMLQYPRINPFLRGRVQASPCPYRSIQANIFRIIVISSKVTLFIFIFWAYSLLIPMYIVVITYKGLWFSKTKFHFSVPDFHSPYRRGSWSVLDWEWLMIRWTHFTELYDTYLGIEVEPRDVSGLHFDDRLLYDAIEGLILVSEQNVTEDPVLYAAYHCFDELSTRVLGMHSFDRQTTIIAETTTIRNNQYVQALLANPGNLLPFHASSLSSSMTHPSINLLHEENLLLFIQAIFTRGSSKLTSEESPNPIWPPAFSSCHLAIMAQHLGELHLRVKGELFSKQLRDNSIVMNQGNPNLLPQHVDWSVVYLFQYVEDFEAKKVFAEKYLDLLSAFFRNAGSNAHIEWKMGGLLTHKNLYHFILNGARTTHYAANTLHGLEVPTLDRLLSAFTAIREGLIRYLSGAEKDPRPDLLFYAACIYVQWITEREAGDSILNDALDDIIPILRSYKTQMTSANETLEQQLDVVFSDKFWTFLALPEVPAVNSGRKSKSKHRGIRLLSRFSHQGPSKTVLETPSEKQSSENPSRKWEGRSGSVENIEEHTYPPNNPGEDSIGAPLLPKHLV